MENVYFRAEVWNTADGGYWSTVGLYQTYEEAAKNLPARGVNLPRIVSVDNTHGHFESVVK
ncbi:hypothetical protein [uncultured Dysosmobacter sp.]|uniref:hypothetical protein n=1 Tax=uncultured Dysosmobacter sp. TaxID=2591384 RepID=UPI002610B05C|nr:hypothetical protein [uncultured Dysosmobacter sp.]